MQAFAVTQGGLVSLANRMVPMPVACRAAGVAVPDVHRDTGTKMHCPWGSVSHSDGGKDPAFRVWPDHAWCFSCREWYSPVRLASTIWEVTPEQAAARLLGHIGYRPADFAHLWQRAATGPDLDYGAVAQALRNYCQTLAPGSALLRPGVAEYMSRCLGLLTQVKDEAEAAEWLGLSKQVMARAISTEEMQ